MRPIRSTARRLSSIQVRNSCLSQTTPVLPRHRLPTGHVSPHTQPLFPYRLWLSSSILLINQIQPDGTYHAYAGDDIEAFLKKELSNRTPTEELVSGETKPPTSGTVFDAMVGTVTDVDVQDSEDGTQYVMTVRLFLVPWCFKIHRMFSRIDDSAYFPFCHNTVLL